MIAVKAIIPKKVNVKAMNDAWLDEMTKFGKFIIKDFEGVVRPWHEPKPEFQLVRQMTAEGSKLIVRVVGPEEGRKKWAYVNFGTRAHTIRARNAKTLAFPSVYHSGSTPGKKFTIAASSSGPTVYASEVQHPGTEARRFDLVIAEDNQKPYEEWMKAAAPRVAEASGHAIK